MTDFQENPPHPLFPPLEDDDDEAPAPLITEILIMRAEQGKKVTCPRMFRGEELLSLTDLAAQYGGGEYELVGRHNNRITARRRYTIPGPLKPMFDEGITSAEVKPAQQAQVINPMQAMMGTGEGSVMGLLMMMMQQMMQAQQAAAQQNTQLMIAMMTNNQQASADEKAAARAEMAANIERERIASERNMAMMREMMSLSQKPGGGSGEDFTRGVEFYRSFANSQIEMARASAKEAGEDGLESILGTLMQAFQGYQALQEMKNGAAAPAVQAVQAVQ